MCPNLGHISAVSKEIEIYYFIGSFQKFSGKFPICPLSNRDIDECTKREPMFSFPHIILYHYEGGFLIERTRKHIRNLSQCL